MGKARSKLALYILNEHVKAHPDYVDGMVIGQLKNDDRKDSPDKADEKAKKLKRICGEVKSAAFERLKLVISYLMQLRENGGFGSGSCPYQELKDLKYVSETKRAIQSSPPVGHDTGFDHGYELTNEGRSVVSFRQECM